MIILLNQMKIIAKALIDKKSPFLRSIIINKGSKNQLNLEWIVLDKSYLVGKIVEVNYLRLQEYFYYQT